MPSDAILIDAIDGLYQVIDDPAQWLPWVKRVSDSVRADGGNIALVDLDKPSRSWMVQNYTTEEQLRNYFNNYVFDDYQKQALDKLPTGKVYHTHSFSQAWQERYLDSRYYQEFASATCMRVSLGSYVHRDQHSAVSTGFHRYDLKQPFSDDAAAFIEKLHPHIERVLKFTEYELFLESTLSAVEPETHQGLFLLDRNGRVVFANSAACAIEASGFLKVKNQHLSAQEAKSNQALQKYISESLSMPPQNMHHRDRVVPVARGPELAPLTAIISPHLKKNSVSNQLPEPIALIVKIIDPNLTKDGNFKVLSHVYGCTAREIEIASALVKGKTLRNITDLMGIRYETVRSHTKSLMGKLNVRTQNQLLLLLSQIGS